MCVCECVYECVRLELSVSYLRMIYVRTISYLPHPQGGRGDGGGERGGDGGGWPIAQSLGLLVGLGLSFSLSFGNGRYDGFVFQSFDNGIL